MKARTFFGGAAALGLLILTSGAAMAQGVGMPAVSRPPLLEQVISTVIFSLLGLGLAIAGFKIFDMAIKFDIEREICEKNNLSAAILASAVVLGACLIVAAVVLS